MKQTILFLLVLITLFFACKKVPTFSEINEFDPESKAYVPEKPGNVNLSVIDPNHIRISWSPDPNDIKPEYIIERKTDNSSYQEIVATKDSLYYLDEIKLIPGTTYSYRVKAATDYKESEYGESPNLQFSLNSVANFSIEGISADSLLLSWKNNNSFETEYQIGLKKLNSSQFEYVTVPKTTRSIHFAELDTSFNYTVTITPIIHYEYTTNPNNQNIAYKRALTKIRDVFSTQPNNCCSIRRASYLDNGKKIVVGTLDGSIIIIDSATGLQLRKISNPNRIQYSVKSFDNGQKFISITNNDITIRDVNGNVLYEIDKESESISGTLFEKNGNQYFVYLVIGKGKLNIYDLKKQTLIYEHPVPEENYRLDIDDSGQYILMSHNYTIEIRSFPDFELLDDIQIDSETSRSINALSFLSNSTDFYYSRYGFSNPAIVREMFYDSENGITSGDSYTITHYAYSLYPEPTGNYLIITGNNGSDSFRFFDLAEKEIKFRDSKLLGTTYEIRFHPLDPEIVLRVLDQYVQEWTFKKNWY